MREAWVRLGEGKRLSLRVLELLFSCRSLPLVWCTQSRCARNLNGSEQNRCLRSRHLGCPVGSQPRPHLFNSVTHNGPYNNWGENICPRVSPSANGRRELSARDGAFGLSGSSRYIAGTIAGTACTTQRQQKVFDCGSILGREGLTNGSRVSSCLRARILQIPGPSGSEDLRNGAARCDLGFTGLGSGGQPDNARSTPRGRAHDAASRYRQARRTESDPAYTAV